MYVAAAIQSSLFSYNDPLSAQGRQYHLFSNVNISKERRNFKKLHDKWKFFMQQEIFNFYA